jgi:hypothetical protein
MTMSSRSYFRHIIDPVLAAIPETRFIGRWLIVGPVDHCLRGVLFDGPPSRTHMPVYKALWPMSAFCGLDSLPQHEQILLKTDDQKYLFDLTDERYPALFRRAFDDIVMPFIESKRTMNQVIAFLNEPNQLSRWGSWHEIPRAWCATVTGDFEEARRQIDIAFQRIERAKFFDLLTTRRFVIMARIRDLIDAGAFSEIGDYLRKIEREMADHNKVSHLYTATVFPFEARIETGR